jgi:hypothetical protein
LPRTLSIIMPNGRTEYWFTDRVFAVGDRLERDGVTWIVRSIGSVRDGKHLSATVRAASSPTD